MTFERPSILLADNDKDSQKTFRSFFERRGWNCTIVSNKESLEEELERAWYDIVIADTEMPGVTPLALLDEVFRKKPSMSMNRLNV